MMAMDEFASHMAGEQYTCTMEENAFFKSSNVIYLIEWKRCSHQYVRKMGQPLHSRINGHWFDITPRRTDKSPVVAQFKNAAHFIDDMAVMVIDKFQSQD